MSIEWRGRNDRRKTSGVRNGPYLPPLIAIGIELIEVRAPYVRIFWIERILILWAEHRVTMQESTNCTILANA